MMRTKRILATLMVLIISLQLSVQGWAQDAYDNIAPVFKGLQIENNTNLTDSMTLKLQLSVEEEGRGVSFVRVKFIGKEQKKEVLFDYVAGEDNDYGVKNAVFFSGNHELIFDLSQYHLPADTYELSFVLMNDQNDNQTMTEAADLETPVYFNLVESSQGDVEGPLVHSFHIEKKMDLQLEKTYAAEVHVTDTSGIRQIILHYEDEAGNEVGMSSCNSESFSSGKVKIPFFVYQGGYADAEERKGIYHLVSIEAEDSNGFFSTKKITKENQSNYDYEIQITKLSKEGIDEPKLTKVTIQKEQVTLPNSLPVQLSLKMGNAPVNYVEIYLKSESGRVYSFDFEKKALNTGSYQYDLPLDPYMESGKYRISTIILHSNYGTTSYYAKEDVIEHTKYYALENVLAKDWIQMKGIHRVAYYGSNANISAALPKIRALKNGDFAVLDVSGNRIASKALFEAIAGKNITVVFQDEDVQWEFCGKDIKKGKCKKIDLTTKISAVKGKYYGFSRDPKVLKVEFKNNGELPGKAKVRVNTEYLSAKYKLNQDLILSYLKNLPEVLDTKVKIEDDGFAEMEIYHNSIYILSDKKPRLVSPSKFKVQKKTKKSVTLTWNKVWRADGYIVYRATSKNGKYKKIKQFKGDKKLRFVDKKVKRNKKYYYRLKAISKSKDVKAVFSKKITVKIK